MKKRLRENLKRVSHRYPFVGLMIKRIYYRKLFNKVKRNIKGKNNRVSYKNAILSSVSFDIKGNENKIQILDDCILNNVLFSIRGNGHRILIGNGCRFNGGGNIRLADHDCSLSIGEYSTFENVHLALTEPKSKITIGKDCMFAYDIDVRTGDSHSIISLESKERLNYAADVSIGDHVWIAAHCILLKGSAIPDDSVVATGSVVTKKYTSNGIIIAGNPAKQVKQGITWSRQRIYKDS